MNNPNPKPNTQNKIRPIIIGGSLAIVAVTAAVVGNLFVNSLNLNNQAIDIVLPDSMSNVLNKKPVSKELIDKIKSALEGKVYGEIFHVYETSIPNIKEVFGSKGIFYVTDDASSVFFGDLVNVDTNVSETMVSRELIEQKKRLISALNTTFTVSERHGPVHKDVTYSPREGLPKKIDNNHSESLSAGLESRKHESHRTYEDSHSESAGEHNQLKSSLLSPANNKLARDASRRIMGQPESVLSDANKTIIAESSEDTKSKLDALRKKWKDRIEQKMSKSGSEVINSHSAFSGSNESQSKRSIDMSKLQTGGAFVSYKGNKKSKIGYSTKGKKLSKSETKAQISEMYSRLDSLGERWSVVYPAIGEEKVGVMVFSDPTCPYCQKLHKSIPTLNKAGVKVTILMYPRALALEKTRPIPAKEVISSLYSAWCSKDPAEAMTKLYAGKSIPIQDDCSIAEEQGRVDLPAAYQYFLGKLFNLKGTPLSFTSEGNIVRGFSNSDKYLNNIGLSKDDRNKVHTELKVLR
ncbi:thioredoxin fold domain-containing protein [Psychromonas sp. SP041]|uniref:thioredoxin fold domain-containing protein n=1 Tax=Psychromonas sp. SP041 TaxID=1365007 RepID=UPI0010C7E0AA|nr:thioredoxin fold domain-containing protein [Psychromonas sp. SP041]